MGEDTGIGSLERGRAAELRWENRQIRARLESAEAALQEIEQRLSFVWQGGTERQCGICHWIYARDGHSDRCPLKVLPRAALGAAGERG